MLIDDLMISDTTEHIIEELRNSLYEIDVKRFNVIRRNGNDVQTNCPFHKDGQEKKPSFGIRDADGMCHCFACDWKGPLPVMISQLFNKNDGGIYGKQWLRRHFASTEIYRRSTPDFSRMRNNNKIEPKYVSEEELAKYRRPHSYWAKRRITDERIIKLFDLGFDEDTNCITMPVRDINCNCLFVARRSVCSKYFNYPAGVEKPIYGLYEYNKILHSMPIISGRNNGKTYMLNNLQSIIVCESMIDALTCWQYGKFAVAMNGLGTHKQYRQLSEMPCRKFILATDNDKAGELARKRFRENVEGKLIVEYAYSSYPKGAKDINDMTEEEFNDLKEVF